MRHPDAGVVHGDRTQVGKWNNLPFELIADENRSIANKYGVWQEKKLYGKTFMGIVRSTFIIDKKGIVLKIFPKVKVKGHIDAILEYLEEV